MTYELPFEVMTVQLHELHGGWFFKLHAQVAGDLPQRVVEMGKVVEGHVSYKCAANFVVARAAMQPPEKHDKLDERGEARDDPVGIHGSVGAGGSSIEAERQTARAESDAKSTSTAPTRSCVKQLWWDAEGAAKQGRVGAVEAGKAAQGRERVRPRRVAECDLILLREVGLVLALRARERVDQLAVAGGVSRARGTSCGVLRQRVECRGERRLR